MSIYNYIFIPLQLAFRIPMTGKYLAFEIVTIVVYLIEIVIRIWELEKMSKLDKTPMVLIQDINDKKLKADKEAYDKKKSIHKYEIVTSIIATIPVSLIVSYTKYYDPWWAIAILVAARLIKIRPLYKLFKWF